MKTRDNRAVLHRRNELAQEQGWTSYGQRRYWTSRWSRETAERLAARCCDHEKEAERAGSIMCASCNEKVNPNIRSTPGIARRRGDWRARLVRTALTTEKKGKS